MQRRQSRLLLAMLPALHPRPTPYASLGLALPSWLPWHPCPSQPCPCLQPHHSALCGSDPPMAMSRLLGGFHVRVIILPVTATTCGAPSGGPGTTSESQRSSIGRGFYVPVALQDHRASGEWAGAGARPDGSPGDGRKRAGAKAPFTSHLGRPEARLCMQLAGRVPVSPVT